MSTHPNTILVLALKPDDLTRKTYRAILAEANEKEEEGSACLKIGGESYHAVIMESDYEEDYQIAADEGDIVVFDMVTYGYGETIGWEKFEAQKLALEEWAKGICERHHCTSRIFITANYW